MLSLLPLAWRPGTPGRGVLRLAIATTVAVGLLAATAGTAIAVDPGQNWSTGSVSQKDDDTLEVGADARTSAPGSGTQAGGGRNNRGGGDPGQQQANLRCTNNSTVFTGVINCEPIPTGNLTMTRTPVGQPAVGPVVLAQQARELLDLPHPQIRLSPPRAEGAVVNLPTWLWLEPASWQPTTVQVTAGTVTVTARATPTETIWDLGDGSRPVRCLGAGTPYVPGRFDPAAPSPDCGHVYKRSSATQPDQRYRVTATTRWQVTWTVAGGTGGGTLSDLALSSSVTVPVLEVQAVNRAT